MPGAPPALLDGVLAVRDEKVAKKVSIFTFFR